MEKKDFAVKMKIENACSKNVGIIPDFDNGVVFFGNKVMALRLVTQGTRKGLWVVVYWRVENIRDITEKSLFSLPTSELQSAMTVQ